MAFEDVDSLRRLASQWQRQELIPARGEFMLSTKVKRAGVLLSLLQVLSACSIGPPQPQANMVFGPASPKAVVILSDKRTLSLLLVDLQKRTAVRGGYLIEPKRVEGATTRFDFRV